LIEAGGFRVYKIIYSCLRLASLDFHSARKDLTFALRSISAHAHGCGVARSIPLGTSSTDLMQYALLSLSWLTATVGDLSA